jgi:hypothetical protein
MKKKYFYSHIVETSSVSLALGDMDITPEQRKHLVLLAEANLHQTIIDLILSELPQEEKKQFLLHMAHDHHEKTWTFLQTRVTGIEEKILKATDELKKQLHQDILEAKKHE